MYMTISQHTYIEIVDNNFKNRNLGESRRTWSLFDIVTVCVKKTGTNNR